MLKYSRRNLDCFEDIAEKMAARGNKRSAIECRAKVKAMHLQYKEVVAHNNHSETGHVECTYYT